MNEGTYKCPICGCATPHAHSPEQIKEWQEQETAPELCERCIYCRGDVPIVKRKAQRNDAGFYFHERENYWDGTVACQAQDIQSQIFYLMSRV